MIYLIGILVPMILSLPIFLILTAIKKFSYHEPKGQEGLRAWMRRAKVEYPKKEPAGFETKVEQWNF